MRDLDIYYYYKAKYWTENLKKKRKEKDFKRCVGNEKYEIFGVGRAVIKKAENLLKPEYLMHEIYHLYVIETKYNNNLF